MNNKILARIVATVMAIAMLGTVSFAASLQGNAIKVAAPTGVYADQTQKTAIAFFAENTDVTEPATDDIIAVYQADNSAALPTTFPIDSTKYTDDKNFVVIRFGGNATDAPSKVAIPLTGTTSTVNFANQITVNEAVYTGVAYFTTSFTAAAGETIDNYGFKITQTGASGKPVYFTGDTTLEGEGTWNYGVLLVGVPTEKEAQSNWTYEAFYNAD